MSWGSAPVLVLGMLAALPACSWLDKADAPKPAVAPVAAYQPVTPRPDREEEKLRRAAGRAKDCDAQLEHKAELHLSLIEEMLERGLYHAALAHLDALEMDVRDAPRSRYLRAEALRRGGQVDAAAPVYRELLGTCLAGLGHFGLGRLAAARCALADAQQELERARALRPVDARIHNDLGYVYFARGRNREAEQEFVTSMQLAQRSGPAARNLLLLLVQQQRRDEAEKLAREVGYNAAQLAALRDAPPPGAGCQTATTRSAPPGP